MEKTMIEKFIQYAKEQFGYDISVEDSDNENTFAELFGGSFLGEKDEFCLPDGSPLSLPDDKELAFSFVREVTLQELTEWLEATNFYYAIMEEDSVSTVTVDSITEKGSHSDRTESITDTIKETKKYCSKNASLILTKKENSIVETDKIKAARNLKYKITEKVA